MAGAKYIYLNSRDELLRIDVSRIVYIEADGNYSKIHCANGLEGLVCTSLAKMESLISHNIDPKVVRFARIGKRFIINMGFIFRISVLRQELVLSDQKSFAFTVPISKEALKKLKDVLVEAKTK